MNSFEEHQYLCQVYHPASSKLLRKYEKSSPPSNLPSVSVFQTSTSQILQVLLNHTTNPRLFDMYYKATNTIIMCSAVRCRKDRWHLWVKTEWGRHLWVRPSPFLLIWFVLFVRLYVHCSAMQKKDRHPWVRSSSTLLFHPSHKGEMWSCYLSFFLPVFLLCFHLDPSLSPNPFFHALIRCCFACLFVCCSYVSVYDSYLLLLLLLLLWKRVRVVCCCFCVKVYESCCWSLPRLPLSVTIRPGLIAHSAEFLFHHREKDYMMGGRLHDADRGF